MSNIKDLTRLWALPDRSSDRAQITLRLPYSDYARLHALKEVYPGRPVNDMLNDLIRLGLDELVDSLPSWKMSPEEAYGLCSPDDNPQDLVGSDTGPRITFEFAFRRLMREKQEDKSDLKAVQNLEMEAA